MSLIHSHSKKGEEPWTTPKWKQSEKRPRMLRMPSSLLDQTTNSLKQSQSETFFDTHPHGNSKPQEASFHSSWKCGSIKPRMVPHHLHEKPFSSSSQPGKREHATLSNHMSRSWMNDAGNHGRWNRHLKREHYKKLDDKIFGPDANKCHDETHAHGTNMKFHTHLNDNGMTAGGLEKLDLAPQRGTGRHTKYGLYTGKYETVRHKQLIFEGKEDEDGKVSSTGWAIDARPAFDNRLIDDAIRANDAEVKFTMQANYDIFRPSHAISMSRLGSNFVNR